MTFTGPGRIGKRLSSPTGAEVYFLWLMFSPLILPHSTFTALYNMRKSKVKNRKKKKNHDRRGGEDPTEFIRSNSTRLC